ncbi:hypothetical protein WG68_04705 [Arsukibacterium ikkense]|uniref:Uncharacterized protein n=1 Tax=Arsukibacterium ikkense TaxID=336831 RepID=A0A0M2V869_9GAMM|nr:hypothetical protein [Arsukibacterium ikkense]KKO46599.1 hypothetical protein WG68_04705 [Arsukibacterium ikkense]
MNNILQLLQKLGEDASLRHLPATQLEQVLNPLDFDPAVKQAIAVKDNEKLASLLLTDNKIVCMIFPAEEPTPSDKPAEEPVKQPSDTPEPAEHDIKKAG